MRSNFESWKNENQVIMNVYGPSFGYGVCCLGWAVRAYLSAA
jgi:hypothetical protein